jgi:hypothetical protein
LLLAHQFQQRKSKPKQKSTFLSACVLNGLNKDRHPVTPERGVRRLPPNFHAAGRLLPLPELQLLFACVQHF